jgi:hypothetical protein
MQDFGYLLIKATTRSDALQIVTRSIPSIRRV